MLTFSSKTVKRIKYFFSFRADMLFLTSKSYYFVNKIRQKLKNR